MKKIIAFLKPFEINQEISIFENGVKLFTDFANVDEVKEKILDYSIKEDIDLIQLAGPTQYSEGIKRQIETINTTKYDNKANINIELI